MTRGTVVVTVVHGRGDHLVRQRRGLLRSGRRPRAHVVVTMDDPLTTDDIAVPGLPTALVPVPRHPLGLPVAAARNRGAQEAMGLRPDLVVFLDVDCIPGPDLVERYERAAREHPDALLSGPVTYLPPADAQGYDLDRLADQRSPHPARPDPPVGSVEPGDDHRLFWSLSFAVTPGTWDRIGGFDEAYVGYGGEDTDFGQRARAAGVPMAWVGGADAFHQHHPVSRPPVEHVEDVVRNGEIFARRWGWWPMEGWLEAFEARGLVARQDDGWTALRPSGSAAP